MKYEFLRSAEGEFEEAARHYNRRQKGLGNRFMKEVRKTISRITELFSPHGTAMIYLILTLFVVSGNMTPDFEMKRISVPGPLSYFRLMPDRGNPFHPLIRCHISEPQNSLEPEIYL